MTKKAPAKATKKAPPKRNKMRKEPTALAVPPVLPDWPPSLPEDQAKALFDAIEDGMTVKAAAAKVGKDLACGMNGASVYRWAIRHKDFKKRLEEAQFIGDEMMADDMVDMSDNATDRDSAAAVKEKREARKDRLRYRNPQKFNQNPFKPQQDELPPGQVFGVIIVPAKRADAGRPPPRRVIDVTPTEVKRLPIEAGKAKPFVLRGVKG